MVKDMGTGHEILKFATGWEAITGTVTNTGVDAGSDGRKILKAGTILGPSTNGKTILVDRDKAKVTSSSDAECVLLEDTDVTSGEAVAPLLTKGYIDLSKYAAGDAPSSTLMGYLKANNPMIVFVG